MPRKTDIELKRAEVAKVTRAIIRLKHSLAADRELNDALPDNLGAFDAALQEGRLLELNAGIADLFAGDRGAI